MQACFLDISYKHGSMVEVTAFMKFILLSKSRLDTYIFFWLPMKVRHS